MTQTLCKGFLGGLFFLVLPIVAAQSSTMEPIVSEAIVFEEINGLVAFEAEHFFKQENVGIRAWYLSTASLIPGLKPDPDDSHVLGASGGAYLEILPDSRWSHNEELLSKFSDADVANPEFLTVILNGNPSFLREWLVLGAGFFQIHLLDDLVVESYEELRTFKANEHVVPFPSWFYGIHLRS